MIFDAAFFTACGCFLGGLLLGVIGTKAWQAYRRRIIGSLLTYKAPRRRYMRYKIRRSDLRLCRRHSSPMRVSKILRALRSRRWDDVVSIDD
jgi:hypothetical protein